MPIGSGRFPVQIISSYASSLARTSGANPFTVFGSPYTAPLDALDQVIESFMVQNNIGFGAVAARDNGMLLLQRCYLPGLQSANPVNVVPNTMLRLASCSKPFTAALARLIIASDKTRWPSGKAGDVKILPKPAAGAAAKGGLWGPPLNLVTEPSQLGDARMMDITVGQLAEHLSGIMDDDLGTTSGTQIAAAAGVPYMTPYAEVRYRLKHTKLGYPPGAPYPKLPAGTSTYSNLGYAVLTAWIMQVTESSYYDCLRTYLFPKISNRDIVPATTFKSGSNPRQWPVYTTAAPDGPTAMDALNTAAGAGGPPSVPAPYGGDGVTDESALGAGGLMASANALAQFADLFFWDGQPLTNGVVLPNGTEFGSYTKSGGATGVAAFQNWVNVSSSRYSTYALLFNSDQDDGTIDVNGQVWTVLSSLG